MGTLSEHYEQNESAADIRDGDIPKGAKINCKTHGRSPHLLREDVELVAMRGACISPQAFSSYRKLSLGFSRILSSFCYRVRIVTMNFVDVQPKSFLDYAWTSPSSATMKASKPSRAGRKQNRCCDQCRKGKRACDAAILEDTLLEDGGSSSSPTVFHYSDVFGPLIACSNCEKTRKTCTFDWLRSQRVLQASHPQPTATPNPKRRRTQSRGSRVAPAEEDAHQASCIEGTATGSTKYDVAHPIQIRPAELGVTFGDFACGNSALTARLTHPQSHWNREDATDLDNDFTYDQFDDPLRTLCAVQQTARDGDSGHGSSLDTLSDDLNGQNSPCSVPTSEVSARVIYDSMHAIVPRSHRKRRRRGSSCSRSNGALPCPALSRADDLASTINRVCLTEGLLQIYHQSFENALACWLTDRTCPYGARDDLSLPSSVAPNWNRIYHRVSRLDRLANTIGGRQLTLTESAAAKRSLDLCIYAFASQWSQCGGDNVTRYPFGGESTSSNVFVFGESEKNTTKKGVEFDRTLQISIWHQAENALKDAGNIESFRVVLAQMVFALTQRPAQDVKNEQEAIEHDVGECQGLMERLNLAIDADGPPLHLEQGLRLIHSLRSRMAMLGGRSRRDLLRLSGQRQYRSLVGLEAADHATVDLLFWLGVMFDTVSAAIHKRPLVVSDEDSNIYPKPHDTATYTQREKDYTHSDLATDGLWDQQLFLRKHENQRKTPIRWPCSFDEASKVLCDAAPIKVLLFRKVTRIQTLLARDMQANKVEEAITSALEVISHWNDTYAPFIQDCIKEHDNLPIQIQSWYICLSGHWHLAALLLIDLIEAVDKSGLGVETVASDRVARTFVASFRLQHCKILSDLARCACPWNDASFPGARNIQFAVRQGAILTEPWTTVLIRAFARAGAVLLEPDEATSPRTSTECENAFVRADMCVKALWHLGRKSDIASAAARILAEALESRRRGAQERLDEMGMCLESDLWDSFGELGGTFGFDCR